MIIYLSVSEQLNYISLFYFLLPFIFRHRLYLPPATKLGQGYVFTRVCDSVHRGASATHPRVDTPWADTPPPGRHPLDRHTPLGRHTPWADNPPQCMLGYGQQAGGTHPDGMQSC